ncbi:uncharacterized protein LY89DRAFT_371883 [Mollisia scopiformis]|uniref:Fucose-specific lectin n=1 Tax=Mollisia scopiformis TaxID=149040 RepID=A0A132B5G4_MOLSC|nr:uncharacterized protein LY89DRAFT_371883 [Mollisia scopiformis]KUJ07229.1 hypothetical protein LY89DRAFT_371883 [Mollisia scopiformis]
MANINYEEVYPTHISHLESPMYSHNASENQQNVPPEVVRDEVGLEHDPSQAQNFISDKGKFQELVASVPATPQYARDDKMAMAGEDAGPSEPRKYCGMSKKMMYAVSALVVIIVIVAVVGAVGGAVASKKSSKSTSVSPTSTSSATGVSATSSATPSATAASSAKLGAIAASNFQDDKSYLSVYYQTGSDIMYMIYPSSGSFSSLQNLTLSTTPKTGTPLAAVSVNGTSGAELSLYYLDTFNNIIEATFSSSLSSTTLTSNAITVIALNSTVSPLTSLAALYLDGYGYRAYYQNTTGYIYELVNGGSAWKAGSKLSALATSGSPLSASMVTVPHINIFYIGETVDELYNIAYDSSWLATKMVTSGTLTSWNSSISSLASAGQSDPNILRTYYIGSDEEIYEFGIESNSTWTTMTAAPDQSPHWSTSDSVGPGAIASLGWSDQMRLYYFHGGNLRQATLDNTTWSVQDLVTV